jgi:hypothetical protein
LKINSLWKPVHQRTSTRKLNKSTEFRNQYIKEHQQESQIHQQPLETSTSNKGFDLFCFPVDAL